MVSNDKFGLAQIEQIAVPVEDVDRALAFYQSQLGMKYLFRSGDLVFFDCGGVRLLLSRPEGAETAAGHASTIYFKVPDIQQAYQSLLARGVGFEDAPHLIANMEDYELWMAFFRDSEHNQMAISGEIRPSRS